MAFTQLDKRPVPDRPGEIRAVFCCRNELMRLPDVLDHHRALGVERFLAIDNDSTDGTTDFLLAQPDVHVFHTTESFAASRTGVLWRNAILNTFCKGYWTLVIDADEEFVFPHAERLGLRGLMRYLEGRGFKGVFTLMIDMYGEGPVSTARPRPGQKLLDLCPYFDPGPYYAEKMEGFPGFVVQGGVRFRTFWGNGDESQLTHSAREVPVTALSKISFVKWQEGMFLGNHAGTPMPLADVWGVLMHFKLLTDFVGRTRDEVKRSEYLDGARDYRVYADYLEGVEDPTFLHEGSVRLKDYRQFVELGIARTSEAFEQFAAAWPAER